ncbi:transposase [Bradyrhizobium barranii subsp. barranii]
MKQVITIGLDLAKHVFQVHGADAEGSPVFNRKLRRSEVLRFFEKLPACLVGMEACGSAHYWAREIAALGHEVRLIPPAYVKPFVKRGKTDAADAEAISEAVTRKTMRFVPIKTAEQQAAAMVLKTRALLVRQRTQSVNALRAHLAELGIIATAGLAKVEALVAIIRDETDARLPAAARFALMAIADEIEASADQIERLERAIVAEAKHDDDMRRLTTIPGVGAITAATKSACAGSRRVQVGSPLCRLAGIDAAASFKRRQRAVGTNIEDGKSRTPLSPRCRGNGRLAACPKRRSGAAVAEGASRQTPLQGCRRRAGQ